MTNHTTPPPSHPSVSRRRLRRCVVAFGLAASAALTACDFGSTSAEYDYTCPEDINGGGLDLIVMSFLDLSASGRSEPVLAERLDVLQIELERVADCEGRATVFAFSNSSAAHVVLLDHSFEFEGATEVARDLDIPKQIDQVMSSIRANVNLAIDRLPADGTDVNAMFVLAADQLARFEPDAVIEMVGFTDGITTTGPVNVNDPELTRDRAIEIADDSLQVDLRQVARVDIRGIGKVAGDAQPPTDYVAAIAGYVTQLCQNATGDASAEKCVVGTATVSR